MMTATTAKRLKSFIFLLSLLYAAVYLVASVTPFFHPKRFWPSTFLSLAFPYLFIGMLGWLFLVLLIDRKKIIWLLPITLIGYRNISSCFGWHLNKSIEQTKQQGSMRLLSWNVSEFIDSRKAVDSPTAIRRQILAFIQSSNADVLCLQDFSSSEQPMYFSNVKHIADSLHYAHMYFSVDDKRIFKGSKEGYGVVIFSRMPFIDTGRVLYNWMPSPESLIWATVQVNGRPIRFYTTHLRSMRLKLDNPDIANNPFITEESGFSTNTTILGKLRNYDIIHARQAIFIKETLNKSPYPLVFCADLNAVPSSYVYHHIASGLQDAFLRNRFGLGGTFDGIAPSIRIDVVLTSPSLKPIQYFSPPLHLSDHFPIVTDIQIPQ